MAAPCCAPSSWARRRAPTSTLTSRWEGDKRVYQAEGDLGNYFPVVGDVLRDKLVLQVDIETVGEIVARSPGEELVLRKRPPLEEGAAPEWVTADGGEWNSAKVAESLQRLANLSTFRFAEGPPAPGGEVLEVTLKTEVGATHTLTVYARSGNSYPATSTGSDYPFLLFVWMVNGFLEAFTTAGPPEE